MMAGEQFTYNYEDLAKLTGLTANTIYQHKTRGKFDPHDIRSVFQYIAQYAEPTLQDEIIELVIRGARLYRQSPTSKNKKKAGKKKKKSS